MFLETILCWVVVMMYIESEKKFNLEILEDELFVKRDGLGEIVGINKLAHPIVRNRFCPYCASEVCLHDYKATVTVRPLPWNPKRNSFDFVSLDKLITFWCPVCYRIFKFDDLRNPSNRFDREIPSVDAFEKYIPIDVTGFIGVSSVKIKIVKNKEFPVRWYCDKLRRQIAVDSKSIYLDGFLCDCGKWVKGSDDKHLILEKGKRNCYELNKKNASGIGVRTSHQARRSSAF